jgi:hypothetical protein
MNMVVGNVVSNKYCRATQGTIVLVVYPVQSIVCCVKIR